MSASPHGCHIQGNVHMLAIEAVDWVMHGVVVAVEVVLLPDRAVSG